MKKFTTEETAQVYCDKIHAFLTENCESYNAHRWATPVADEDDGFFYISEPREATATNLYKVKRGYWVRTQLNNELAK